jgi:hypothetical protein
MPAKKKTKSPKFVTNITPRAEINMKLEPLADHIYAAIVLSRATNVRVNVEFLGTDGEVFSLLNLAAE